MSVKAVGGTFTIKWLEYLQIPVMRLEQGGRLGHGGGMEGTAGLRAAPRGVHRDVG